MSRVYWQNGGWFAIPNLFADDPMPRSAYAVAVMAILCRYADGDGKAWPGKKRIAAMAGMSVRRADGAVKELVESGWLSVVEKQRDDGGNATNDYALSTPHRMRVHSRTGCGYPPAQDAPNSDLSESDLMKKTTSAATASAFLAFWTGYPRRIGKHAAELKYAAALKHGAAHDEIMAGVARLVAKIAKDGTAPQYVPHPATWLFQERWKDEDYRPPTREQRPEKTCPSCHKSIVGRCCLECGWYDGKEADDAKYGAAKSAAVGAKAAPGPAG